MTNLLSKNFLSPVLVGLAVWIATSAPTSANPLNSAQKIGTQSSTETSSTAPSPEISSEQVEQAKKATEIKPTDWAYQTLQSLSTKYGCDSIVGDEVLSREKFATKLNGCVQSIEELVARRKVRKTIKKRRPIAAPEVAAPEITPPAPPQTPVNTAPVVPAAPPAPVEPPEPQMEAEVPLTQQDFDRLKQLIISFGSDLEAVESKLKAQSFSTTTKLNGEVILSFSGYGGVQERAAVAAVPDRVNLTTGAIIPGTAAVPARAATGNLLGDRVRLNFDTSFTGKDLLRTRLQSRNITSFSGNNLTGTNSTRLGYDGDSTNNTSVSLLKYSFPISPSTKITSSVIGAEFNDEYYNFNPVLESSGGGAISRFGRFNPVYRLSNDGAQLGIDHKFSKELGLVLAYAIPNSNSAANPGIGSGPFNGSNAIFSQLRFTPTDELNLGLIYARSYHTNGANLSGGTGSSLADNPFAGAATSANHYSFLATYKLDPGFIVSGWAGFTDANRETAAGGNANISNYAVSLAFPDFGEKGNNLAFVLGIPPKLNSRSGNGLSAANTATNNPDTSYHIEALYRVKLSDSLSITPGLLLITNPEHRSANPTEYVGTIRTTFKF